MLATRSRGQHIQTFAEQGRIAWQRKTGYNLRSYVELAMQRYKRIFGNTMKTRALPQQKTEAWITVSALNRMINLGMPVSEKNLANARNGELWPIFDLFNNAGHNPCTCFSY